MAPTPDGIGTKRHDERAREHRRHDPGPRHGLGPPNVADILGFGQSGPQ